VSVTVTARHSCSLDNLATASAACIAKPSVASHPAAMVASGIVPHPLTTSSTRAALLVPASIASRSCAMLGVAISRVPAATRAITAVTHTANPTTRGRMRRVIRAVVDSRWRARGSSVAGMPHMIPSVPGPAAGLLCSRHPPDLG